MALHPIVAKIIAGAYKKDHGKLHEMPLNQVRNYFRQFSKPSPYILGKNAENYFRVFDHNLKKGVHIKFHQVKSSSQKVPLLIYLRASAYCLGDISDSDLLCFYLSKYLNCIVAALEIRLSPETKFPLPFEDCLDCIQYIIDNHKHLNINLKKTAIWGESSGGNLAAALCLHLNKEKNDLIKNQVLFYPMLDYSQLEQYPSKFLYGKGYMLDNTLTDWFLNQYVTSERDFKDERISPLLSESFKGYPATLIISAECDPMRDEAACFVRKLTQANVFVQSLFMPGLTHGFLWYSNRVDEARFPLYYAADYLLAQMIRI